jgi:hypothetical protein
MRAVVWQDETCAPRTPRRLRVEMVRASEALVELEYPLYYKYQARLGFRVQGLGLKVLGF